MSVQGLFYLAFKGGVRTLMTKLIKTIKLPKLHLSQYLTEQALASVSGSPSVYSKHTDGTRCDTSKGCNCGSK